MTATSRLRARARTGLAVAALLALAAGCSHRQVPPGPALQKGSLQSGGRERTFLFHVPPSDRPLPLVIAFHGRLGTAEGMAWLSSLGAVAAREGFAVAFPNGYDRSWADARRVTGAAQVGVDDAAFVRALIAWFVGRQAADPARIYAVGMSNGGFFTLDLACGLSDLLAAAASVTGTVSRELQGTCAQRRPVPVAFFLGEEDPLIPFQGGPLQRGARGSALSGPDSAGFFASRYHCGAPAQEELPDLDPADRTRVVRTLWRGCDGGAEVALYAVKGGGHTWPGGPQYAPESMVGRTSRDLDASTEAWRFLSRFSLPTPPPGPAPAAR